MDSFLSGKASSFLSGKTDDSQPENKNENKNKGEKPQHPQRSNSDLLLSAQLVAEAAKSSVGGESDKVDKGKVAGAGADLLDATSKYGNLEQKNYGKYVDKAEDYLQKYNTSHSTTTTDSGHSVTETEATTTDSGKSGTATTTPTPTTDSPAKSGGDGGSEGGYGDYLKMGEGFLKKH